MALSEVGATGRVFDTVNVEITLNADGRTTKIVETYPKRTVTTNYTYVSE